MQARKLNSDEFAFLKTATRRLNAACGGVDSASSQTRVGPAAIGHYQNPQMIDSFMPLDVAAELERDCGIPHLTQAMARLAGGYFQRPLKTPSVRALADSLPGIGDKAGKVLSKAGRALADGKLTEREQEALSREIEALIAAAIAAKEAIEGGKM